MGGQFFKISSGSGLIPLLRSDTEIEKIVGRAVLLGSSQKHQFLRFIRDNYFQAFTDRAEI